MQKYVGTVVDVGVVDIRIFYAIPQFCDFRNIFGAFFGFAKICCRVHAYQPVRVRKVINVCYAKTTPLEELSGADVSLGNFLFMHLSGY